MRLTSITRSNTTAHLQLSKDLTTGPGPAFYVQRRAAFGTGAWEELPGPVSGTNALLPFADTTATNAQNFYRVRVGP
jgi:hypothetical protein